MNLKNKPTLKQENMSRTKQTWRLIVKSTGELIVRSSDLDKIKTKSLELMEANEDHKYRIQYFENDLIIETVELSVYF